MSENGLKKHSKTQSSFVSTVSHNQQQQQQTQHQKTTQKVNLIDQNLRLELHSSPNPTDELKLAETCSIFVPNKRVGEIDRDRVQDPARISSNQV